MPDSNYVSRYWDSLRGKSVEGLSDSITASEPFLDPFQGNSLQRRDIILHSHGEL
jgi:hypothetical protein